MILIFNMIIILDIWVPTVLRFLMRLLVLILQWELIWFYLLMLSLLFNRPSLVFYFLIIFSILFSSSLRLLFTVVLCSANDYINIDDSSYQKSNKHKKVYQNGIKTANPSWLIITYNDKNTENCECNFVDKLNQVVFYFFKGSDDYCVD